MKKSVLFLLATICCMAASAEVPARRMLEQGKVWVYFYQSADMETTPYMECMSYYQLDGDTVIDGRQYMKMYRRDDRDYKKKYFGALREDEEGRVYMYDYNGDKQDHVVLDLTMQDGRDYEVTRTAETIMADGQLFRRYRYYGTKSDGTTFDMGYAAVEGVGVRGVGMYIQPPVDDSAYQRADYETLAYVYGNGFWFSDANFLEPKVIELSNSEQRLIASNNDFAFRLFRQVRGEGSSIVSPLSITYALGMMNNGAAGQTQQEINQTLGFGEAGADGINAFCQKMLSEASTLDPKTKALISNTIFVNEGLGYRLQNGFTEKANAFYNAEPQNRDFNDGETMDVINQWANDHTEGMIPTVLDKESFHPEAVSYLLNALYFKGVWSIPFDVDETKEEAFEGGSAVPMMHKYADFTYADNDLYQAIVLPYGNGAYRMTVFLPHKDKTIGDVLDALDSKNWQVRGGSYEVDLKLPRFETENNINLVQPMSDLGMPTAFTLNADFPYFCNVPVYISNMFQVAKIKLDEQGTEAAAVTVIENYATGMPKTATFHATRPFLYIISEQSTGAIFFMGQYMGSITAGNTDGIHETKNEASRTMNDAVYDLSGRHISNSSALRKGVYIRGGRVVIK